MNEAITLTSRRQIPQLGGMHIPAVDNSFAAYRRMPWWRRNLTGVIFAIVCLIQAGISLARFTFDEDFEEFADIFSLNLNLGAFAARPRSVAEIIEVDEVFGNQYIKKTDKVVKDAPKNQPQSDYGEGEVGDAVDLSLGGGVKPPVLKSNLKKIFPKVAKDYDVTATVYLELLIDKTGKVRKVDVLTSTLTKKLPDGVTGQIKGEFANAARQILNGAMFSPTYIDGKPAAIKMELPFVFDLK